MVFYVSTMERSQLSMIRVVEIISPPTGMEHERFEFHYHYFKAPSLFVSINSLLVDEIVYDLLADFGYSNTDRKVLYCVYGFHFLT